METQGRSVAQPVAAPRGVRLGGCAPKRSRSGNRTRPLRCYPASMVFGDALTKAGRLVELQLLFSRHPSRSHSTVELAAQLGVAERTVRNYLNELSNAGRLPIYYEDGRWKLAPGARFEIPPVTFLLEEAAAVYLAAHLLCRHPRGRVRALPRSLNRAPTRVRVTVSRHRPARTVPRGDLS